VNGCLALQGGILYLARHAVSVEVRAYDLDGARIGEGFRFTGANGARARADGIAVDRDMRIRVADSVARAVRTFTVFGVELDALVARTEHAEDGERFEPVTVAVAGVERDQRLLVGSRGTLRHAVMCFDGRANLLDVLRSRGDPLQPFQDVARVAIDGRFQLVCEKGARLVQVFRDGAFHFALKPPRPRGASWDPVPTAARRLSDGRFVVATAQPGGVHLFEPSGRLIHTIAYPGERASEVSDPTDVAVDEGASDRRTRVAVVDSDGDRVQVYNLEGVCYGSFADLPRATGRVAEEST
jgi:hypothetical protein